MQLNLHLQTIFFLVAFLDLPKNILKEKLNLFCLFMFNFHKIILALMNILYIFSVDLSMVGWLQKADQLYFSQVNKKQQQMEESIYNIIPKEYNPPAKQPLYKSKFPPNVKPTGSTFCNHTTSKPLAANLGGEFGVGLQAHTEYGDSKTLGHVKGDRKPVAQSFLKKHTGTMGNETLPPVNKFNYDCRHKKDPVPRAHEKPVHGLQSNKNFIVTNAIENILSTAKKTEQPSDWTKKKDFGQTPDYLNRIKDNIQNEYKMIQNLHMQYNDEKKCLPEDDIREIRAGLKTKWDEINKDYQKLTHVRLIDTTGLKRRKEGYEKELGDIEADIKKLNKLYVFVD